MNNPLDLSGIRRGIIAPRHADKIGRPLGAMRTCDIAFTFRMGAGFAGDVNRGHPASIQPCIIDINAPPTAFGQAVVIDATTQGVRPLSAGDTALVDIWGVTVRAFPYQQSTSTTSYGAAAIGGGAPPSLQPVDVLRAGYILVAVNGTPIKGGAVFVWCAATSGAHVQGGFEVASSGGNTCSLSSRYLWNSPPDANGVAELCISF